MRFASRARSSSEGRLRERFERVSLDEDLDAMLRARFVRKPSALSDAYVMQTPASGGTFSSLQFELEFGPDGLRAKLYEELRRADSVSEGAAIARISAAGGS